MKKELKINNKDINIDLIDILSHIDPTNTNKFLPLLVNELKENTLGQIITKQPHQMHEFRHSINEGCKLSDYTEDDFLKMPMPLINYIHGINSFFSDYNNLNINLREMLSRFEELCQKNIIINNDIQQYKNLSEVKLAVDNAEFLLMLKDQDSKKQVLFDSDSWLLIRPLTFETSVKYGYGTKWCTAMRNNSEYFNRYSKDFALLYLFNKKTKEKFGVQIVTREGNPENEGSSQPINGFYTKTSDGICIYNEFYVGAINIYNAADNQVDSFKAKIPDYIMKMLYNPAITDQSNYHYMLKNAKEYAEKIDNEYQPYEKILAEPEAEPAFGHIEHIPTEVANEPIDGETFFETVRTSPVSVETYIGELVKVLNQRKRNIFTRIFGNKKLIILFTPPEGVEAISRNNILNSALKNTNYNVLVFPSSDGQTRYEILK